MAQAQTREAPINIRARHVQRDLIDKAASLLNKSRSDFMLEAACQAAENVLLDQRLFSLEEKAFAAFEKALKAPVGDVSSLRKLLAEKAPWEK